MALSQEEIRKIVQLRGLGFTKKEIADELGVSRKTVENHLRRIKKRAERAKEDDDLDDFFAGLILGAIASAAISRFLSGHEKDRR